MEKDRNVNVPLIVGIVLLTCLVIVLGVTLSGTLTMWHETQVIAAATPTPAPTWFNAMEVTIDPSAPTPPPMLKTGSQGPRVLELQQRLTELGYYEGVCDGQYGAQTQTAVIAFQQVNGIEADGIAGTETLTILFSEDAIPAVSPAPSPTAEAASSPVPTGTPYSTPVPTDTPAPTATPALTPKLTPTPAATDTPAPELPEADTPSSPWYTADGLPLLVNSTHPLPDNYQTVHLVNMTQYCDKNVVRIKANGIEAEQEAVDALMVMLRAAKAEGIGKWQVNAAWRSVKYQKTLFDRQVQKYIDEGKSRSKAVAATRRKVADPGCSEHHTGLAFDISYTGASGFKGTKQAKWLEKHCWEYGFILRYPAGKTDITGIMNEPWHFRYVGVEHALRMRDEDLCLEEYIEKYGETD